MTLPDLKTIAEHARKDAYSIERIQWHKGVDTSLFYFPEVLTPLFHCPSYSGVLNADERRTYNQLFAQYVSEQFIFLEDRFLCKVVEGLLPWAAGVSFELRSCLEIFLEEEIKHTEMFRRLLKLSNPERYATQDFYFLRLKKHEDNLIKAMAQVPRQLNFWIWVALLFEEKTIDYFSHYRMQQRDNSKASLDTLHYQVHQFHMLDEARHVQIDEHLLKYIFEQSPSFIRSINTFLLRKAMANYTEPKRANILIVEELCAIHPRIRSQVNRLANEVRAQRGQSPYQQAQFSRKNFPKTFSYFDFYSDIGEAMRGVIKTYVPEEERKSA
ncbi:hypothetical protein EBU99_07500 [bacterium]|nr:hypothetical protein [bacterium]